MSQKNVRVTGEKVNMSEIHNTYCNRLADNGRREAFHEAALNNYLRVLSEHTAKMDNLTLTENGALTYRTSGSALVDFQARATELRYANREVLMDAARRAYMEDPILAVKLFFQTGDIRGGKGERAIFNGCMDYLASYHPAMALEVLPLIPEYTRWDYLVRLSVSENEMVAKSATKLVCDQFHADLETVRSAKEGEAAHVSLLGKWMPSLQTKKAQDKAVVRHFLRALKLKERDYRHALSQLRACLNVIEKPMSSKDYDAIDMEKMTSQQQLRYHAFLQRAMSERRHAYIQAVLRGEAKMNASVLNPIDICHEYYHDYKNYFLGMRKNLKIQENEDLEALWSLLPDRTSGNGNTLVVRDGSGSMTRPLGHGSTATMLEAATAMTLYCAERLTGPLKDKFITFSSCPRLIDLPEHASLKDRLKHVCQYDECSNTDIEATFDLLLNMAVKEGLSQEDLPSYLLILSDMEFDEARSSYRFFLDDFDDEKDPYSRQTLFETIRKKWTDAGYQVPTLVFWNLNGSRTTFPEIDSENGVIYLSGFSTSELAMVMSGQYEMTEDVTVEETVMDEVTGEETKVTKTVQKRRILSPKEQLIAKLSKERYDAVEAAALRGLEKEKANAAS